MRCACLVEHARLAANVLYVDVVSTVESVYDSFCAELVAAFSARERWMRALIASSVSADGASSGAGGSAKAAADRAVAEAATSVLYLSPPFLPFAAPHAAAGR